jgi:hypothetical protein
MTTEDSFRNELLAREARLQDEIQNLTVQLNAVRTMLGATAPPEKSAPVTPMAKPTVLPATPHPTSALSTPAHEPVAAILAAPPVPDDRLSARGRKRGWIMDRIEQLIDEGDPTFSFHTIFEAYRAKWGWKRYPSKDTLSTILWKLARKRRYTVLNRGGGRSPTLYQKPAQANTPANP